MDLIEKTKFWRGLQKMVNNPTIDRVLVPFRGAIGKVSAMSTKSRPEHEVPWTPFGKKLAAARICVVNTAGLYLEGQDPFDINSGPGDPTFRTLPSDFDSRDLRVAHAHYSHARFHEDHNVILPIDRLRDLVESGVLAGLAPNFYSFGFGGGLTGEYIDPETGTAHELAKRLRKDQADFVLFVPA